MEVRVVGMGFVGASGVCWRVGRRQFDVQYHLFSIVYIKEIIFLNFKELVFLENTRSASSVMYQIKLSWN